MTVTVKTTALASPQIFSFDTHLDNGSPIRILGCAYAYFRVTKYIGAVVGRRQ